MDQEELELEQDATTHRYARVVALVVLVLVAVGLYVVSLVPSALK